MSFILSKHEREIALRVIKKWLKKRNMARCLRDILPACKVSGSERDKIAYAVHEVVRWRYFCEWYMERHRLEKSVDNYLEIALNRPRVSSYLPDEVKYSASSFFISSAKWAGICIDYMNMEPKTHLCVNLNVISRDDALHMLRDEGYECDKGALEASIIGEQGLRRSSLVLNNMAHVQDVSSQYVSYIAFRLAKSCITERRMNTPRVLDCCAGTGGKAIALSSYSRNNVRVFCYDIDKNKREVLRERARAYRSNITVMDRLPKNLMGYFDVVMVDPPCSGMGAARRNPEAKYVVGVSDWPDVQKEILEYYAQYAKDDGYILYSVCTFSKEETEDLISSILSDRQHKFDVFNDFEIEGLNHIRKMYGVFVTEGDVIYLAVLRAHR
ncbi:MAG: hypothetical protein DRN20_04180 [Thermoplasmata archaeon]|nr:MAG: hypothetical protein DRN20_04180 [Thermoplasmata archaeon]